MIELWQYFLNLAGGSTEILVLVALFAGVAMLVFGLVAVTAPPDPIDRRLEAASGQAKDRSQIAIRLYGDDAAQSSLGKIILPQDQPQRLEIRRKLARAGFNSNKALINYCLIRATVGLALPLPLLLGVMFHNLFGAGPSEPVPLLEIEGGKALMGLAAMLVVGFYGPSIWLNQRVASRQNAIQNGFPHALDMLQVAIEAGLGFDSALARIANELRHAHPALAEEFAIVGLELRAGKSRDQVLTNLAERTGVNAVQTFTTVMLQSITFGTSVAGALQTFAQEMRHKRMSKAEEKANQLPVKMSFVMVLLLLPTLFLIALSPVAIRLGWMFSSDLFKG